MHFYSDSKGQLKQIKLRFEINWQINPTAVFIICGEFFKPFKITATVILNLL
jgi:hypothetical protein